MRQDNITLLKYYYITTILSLTKPHEQEDFQFDPVDLRTKRQAALANAMAQPILKSSSGSNLARDAAMQEQYPFVFDSQAKAKTAAGFIQGVKMALPSGFERKDDKKWEEV